MNEEFIDLFTNFLVSLRPNCIGQSAEAIDEMLEYLFKEKEKFESLHDEAMDEAMSDYMRYGSGSED